MHETVFASSILRIVQDELGKCAEKSLAVKRIELHVGLLSCLEPRTLEGCFAIMSEGTPVEGARLEITTLPLRGRCPECGKEAETTRRSFACPHCRGNQVDWQGGREMYIASIEVVPV